MIGEETEGLNGPGGSFARHAGPTDREPTRVTIERAGALRAAIHGEPFELALPVELSVELPAAGHTSGVSPRHQPATQAELSRIGLLAELPGEQLFQLAKLMRREDVPGGEAPIVEGEEGDRFYVVLNGMFAVSNLGSMPRRMLRPGDYFGEVALTMDIPRTASVRALTPAVVASCDKQTFDEFLRPLFADH
jgi:hypothetical protein